MNLSVTHSRWIRLGVAVLAVLAASCAVVPQAQFEHLQGAEETRSLSEGVSGSMPVGTILTCTTTPRLRSGPSKDHSTITILFPGAEVELEESQPDNEYYAVRYQGTSGWIHGSLLAVKSFPDGDPAGADETSYPIGTVLKTLAEADFRKGPGAGFGSWEVLPEGTQLITVNAEKSENEFFNVDHNGTIGWVHESLVSVEGGAGPTEEPGVGTRADAIQRARAGVGFSYWWGHGRWNADGVTSDTKGKCRGECPDCSHRGDFGADCSGYVAKVWQVPEGNTNLSDDSHPYSTSDFYRENSQWERIERRDLQRADALVRRSSGSGHIVLYESGDAWGSFWAYECKGCAAGCVRNLRSVSSSYRAIRRTGY